MKTFDEWVQETHPELDEDWRNWAKGAALAGALGAGALGYGRNSQPDPSQSQMPAQTQDATDSEYHFNDQIGRYTVANVNGQTLYQTQKGTFKKVPSRLSPQGFKFIRVQ